MATDIPMPKLGLTMEEATIIEWLVPQGATVSADQPLLRIETDKTETEVGSPNAGRVHQLGQPGEIFACGVRIGWLLADGEAAPSDGVPVVLPTGRVVATPYARALAAQRGVSLASVRGTGPGGRIVADDVLTAPAIAAPLATASPVAAPLIAASHGITTANVTNSGAVVASVAARQLADLLGVELALVGVDPVEQRVTRDSVVMYVRQQLQQLTAPAAATTSASTEVAPAAALMQTPSELIRLSGMRGTIAKRMTASLREMAQLTLTMDADMSAILADRAQRKQSGAAPSITDYVVAATARALVKHPRMNSQIVDGAIAVLPDVHVGLAVSLPNGLMVPVIRDTTKRTLGQLAAESARLAGAVRDGSIVTADLVGGTFSVSALGAFGVDSFTPVINPPNAGIIGIGRLRDQLSLSSGSVTSTPTLTLSLTWDHRVVDGVPAAEFCQTIVALLATPVVLDAA